MNKPAKFPQEDYEPLPNPTNINRKNPRNILTFATQKI